MNFKQMQKVLSVICAMGMMMSTAQTTVLAAQASSTETTQSDSVQSSSSSSQESSSSSEENSSSSEESSSSSEESSSSSEESSSSNEGSSSSSEVNNFVNEIMLSDGLASYTPDLSKTEGWNVTVGSMNVTTDGSSLSFETADGNESNNPAYALAVDSNSPALKMVRLLQT